MDFKNKNFLEKKAMKCLELIKQRDKEINAFLQIRDIEEIIEEARILDKKALSGKVGRLYGYIIAIKSNINVKGMNVSCASKTLENYKGSYDAFVIEKIKAEDGLIIGMTNCDEFAAGSSGENSAFGATFNPLSVGCVSGGSSSGSAAAVSAGFCDLSLGSDTGGSIRTPASFCGVVGVKPSYGCVSRYGLIDLSMSLDQIGPIARNISDAALLLDVIKGFDEKDSKSFDTPKIKLKKLKKILFGVVDIEDIDPRIRELFEKKLGNIIELKKWISKKIKINYIDLAVQTYHPIVWTEFYSATRRFDGRKYGKKIEDSGGKEVLRRIFGGKEIARAEFKGKYYKKALQVKDLIKKEFERVFHDVDCIIMPTVPVLPWKVGSKISVEDLYNVDKLAIPANLAEVCSVSIPIGNINDNGILKPAGMQIICPKWMESKMLSIAKEIEGI